MRNLIVTILILPFTFIQAYAVEDYANYNEIISELSRPKNQINQKIKADLYSGLNIHAGASYITTNISVYDKNIKKAQGTLSGIEASLGIDLFSAYWSAEGALRAFKTQQDKNHEFNLKEFDLRIVYRNYITRRVKLRTGFGIAARYLNITDLSSLNALREIKAFAVTKKYKYTTPASILFLGIENYITDSLSLGVEVSYRASLIDETADQSSLAGSFKLETHF